MGRRAMRYPLYVFDAYGTLFDVHSAVARHRDAVGAVADQLSDIWRTKQLEYTWVRALAGAYQDFWITTEQALDHATARVGGIPASVRDSLLDAYRTLDAYPEVRQVLTMLKARGARTAILSNGSPAMLDSAVRSAGIATHLDAVLSVDLVKSYKTDPKVYAIIERELGVPPERTSFQSSNRWDIAGAAAFGFRTVWINRAGAPDEYRDLPPDRVTADLGALVEE